MNDISGGTLLTISGDTIFAFLLVLAFAGIAVRAFAWEWVRGLLAGGWPTTQGRVEFGNVACRHTRYKDFYVARLDYSYSVNNEYFSGHYEKVFLWERSADRFIEALKGQLVTIRYKMEKAERSVLLVQDQLSWPR